MNEAAKLGIKKRLSTNSGLPATFLTNIPFCPHTSSDGVQSRFDDVVRQCCSFVRKPLAYIQRGLLPPQHLHKAAFYFDTLHDGKSEWWTVLIYQEVLASLTQDGMSSIRYGPKPQDVYHSPPFECIWRESSNKDISYVNCSGCHAINLQSTGIELCFEVHNHGTHWGESCQPHGLSVYCSFNEEIMCTALQHIITAKVISARTGIAEEACRQ
eukprot:2032851-Rhodomonas_salina.1